MSTPKFEAFWSYLKDHLDIGEETKPIFLDAVLKAGYNVPVTVTKSVMAPVVVTEAGKKKQLTGYHMFVKARNAELKGTVTDAGDRQKQIVAEWKAFSEPEKAGWKAKVSSAMPTAVVPNSTESKRPMTGYQFFMKGEMANLRVAGNAPSSCMALGAKAWKALSDEERKGWTTKVQEFMVTTAVGKNDTVIAPAEPIAPGSDGDIDIEALEEPSPEPISASA